MSRVVLDSSALLAYLNDEPGAAAVKASLAGALICSVNACEIATKLFAKKRALEEVRFVLQSSGAEVVDFDFGLAIDAGHLTEMTRGRGLSLGDRACLALAAREKLPALTADRAWKGVDIGVPIQFIR
jgi:ribonuclease VapC